MQAERQHKFYFLSLGRKAKLGGNLCQIGMSKE
jgi:hypothetical protein